MRDTYLVKALNRGEKIYGLSVHSDFDTLGRYVVVFEDIEVGKKWVDTCEYDFRQRELMTRAKAVRIAGRRAVDDASPSMYFELDGQF